MTEPAVVPPNGTRVTGEFPCATPGQGCPSNGKVATRPWVYFVLNRERLKIAAALGSAIALSVGTAWVLASSSSADAASALGAHEAREREFREQLRADVREMGRDARKTRELVEKTLGPMSPTPAVREPGP